MQYIWSRDNAVISINEESAWRVQTFDKDNKGTLSKEKKKKDKYQHMDKERVSFKNIYRALYKSKIYAKDDCNELKKEVIVKSDWKRVKNQQRQKYM